MNAVAITIFILRGEWTIVCVSSFLCSTRRNKFHSSDDSTTRAVLSRFFSNSQFERWRSQLLAGSVFTGRRCVAVHARPVASIGSPTNEALTVIDYSNRGSLPNASPIKVDLSPSPSGQPVRGRLDLAEPTDPRTADFGNVK